MYLWGRVHACITVRGRGVCPHPGSKSGRTGPPPPAQRVAPLHFYNVSAQDVLPAWVPLLTTGLLGFLPTWARSCLENTDPRTRGRGIQLLSQVLLQCYSLLQEKEGKGCSGPLSGCRQIGGKACATQVSVLQLAKELIQHHDNFVHVSRVKVQGGHGASCCSLFANHTTQFRSLPEHAKALGCSWCPRQCVGVAHPGVLSATWDTLGTHLHVKILGW